MRIRKTVNICLTAAAFAFAFAVNAENAVNVSDVDVDSVGNVNIVNDVDTVNNTITSDRDTAGHDDIKSGFAASTFAGKDSSTIGRRPLPPKISDEPPLLLGAHWGLGMGLSVGTVPIFPMWQKYFPDSLRLLGLSPTFAADSGDGALLRYRVTESPDPFNFTTPFCLSVYSIGESRVYSFTVSFFRNSKEFQSELSLSPDSTGRRINTLERLVYYSVSIEAAGRWAIPQDFFSIDGTQQTLLTIALGASPVNFTRESELKTNFDNDTRMSAVADSAKKTFAALSGNGLSLSWRIGISAIKRYPSGYGAEFGIFYSGAYSNYFYSDGIRLTEDHIKTRGVDLNAENVINGKPLSFISSQLEFRVTVLVPTNKKRDKD